MFVWMRVIFFAMGLCLPFVAPAEVYRWVDEAGNVVFSDRPRPGAEELKNLDLQSYPAPKLPITSPKSKSEKLPLTGYTAIEIASPNNDETIWDNTGSFAVSVRLRPALHSALGHKVVLLLDGNQVMEPGRSTQFQLTNIDRGTHTLRAAIVDRDGKEVASSDATTIYLHRQSSLFPDRKTTNIDS